MWTWTDYLLAFVILYFAFIVTVLLFKGTALGDGLIKFASEPKPTTAAGWLEKEVFPSPKPRPPAPQAIRHRSEHHVLIGLEGVRGISQGPPSLALENGTGRIRAVKHH